MLVPLLEGSLHKVLEQPAQYSVHLNFCQVREHNYLSLGRALHGQREGAAASHEVTSVLGIEDAEAFTHVNPKP